LDAEACCAVTVPGPATTDTTVDASLNRTLPPGIVRGPRGLQGPQGAQGAQGSQGPQGPRGPQGDKGDSGDTGAAATRLFVNVREDCASFEDSRALWALPSKARCAAMCAFDRDLTGCVAAATQTGVVGLPGGTQGDLVVGEPGDAYAAGSYVDQDNDEVAVSTWTAPAPPGRLAGNRSA
jgi:hypothetical protein